MLFERIESKGLAHYSYLIHITQIPERMDEVPRDRSVYIFCGTGLRAMVVASLLRREGWQDMTVVLGGLAGWNSIKCPVKMRIVEDG